MLEVINLSCGYGDITAVHSLSLQIDPGEVLALIGPNGAGKTSTILCLAGLVTRLSGEVRLDGKDISDVPARARAASGLAIVPEGRRVFADLSVAENLVVGAHTVKRQALRTNQDKIYSYFPRLMERRTQRAGSLSGGEQQMLAIGRALMSDPKLLLVDELSLGLMPKMIDECYAVLAQLKATGVAIMLVEQSTERALAAADRVCVLEAGNMTWQGTAAEAQANTEIIEALLGVDKGQAESPS
ncbi:MAG: ABC transporter ATP-binding protein [Alphaproteobacteria bacterium]